nr:zinc finger matrin-type protein 1-like isoform X2 [Gorilla gorilla gorilla]
MQESELKQSPADCLRWQNRTDILGRPRNGSSLLLRLECSGTISTHCSLCILGSRNPSPSASSVAGTTGVPMNLQEEGEGRGEGRGGGSRKKVGRGD